MLTNGFFLFQFKNSAMSSPVNSEISSGSSSNPTTPQAEHVYRAPNVILKLLLHTVAMFTLPFIAYYKTNSFVRDEFNMTRNQSFISGAIAAVITVNLVIASYVYQAFKENESERQHLLKKGK